VSERAIRAVLLVMAPGVVLALALITFFILQAGLALIVRIGLVDFLGGTVWAPTADPAQFGILPMIVGSVWLTFGALLIGVPLGLAVAVFQVELAPAWLAMVLRPTIQLLAGIPSVIYGFIGLTLLAPLVRATLGGPGLSVLTGAIVLGIMILPSVIAVSEDALRAVPPAIRDGATALGATQWQMIWGVLIPTARSGIIAGVILGMGRALGETMAVIMMVGNALTIPRSPLDSATTLTSNIALELAYAGGAHREALFATGVVLFCLIMGLNAVATALVRQRTFSRRGG
jgi:phosphate ABC transporter permease protein PstC